MITPIDNVQPSFNFQGVKLKTPKKLYPIKNQPVQNKTERKFSKFIQKTKNEFKNMDNETRELLIDCILLSCTIAGIIGVAAYYIHQFIEKIQNIFQ